MIKTDLHLREKHDIMHIGKKFSYNKKKDTFEVGIRRALLVQASETGL